ncbi:MAG: selenide, water dikinase SelD [Deltaproteobacteria bacterium]|nr:selenide, water dikinase SelD [Deltaproteobacteria bacterium]
MKSERDVLIVFGTVQRVMRAERVAREQGCDVDVIPAPRTVSSECGMVLEATSSQAAILLQALEMADLGGGQAWRRQGDLWLPSTLQAMNAPSSVALTRGSAYGGCGAKLSRGQLSTLLCGLPRLESPDLLVGIETIDDAGVVRVAPDLAIVHTVDFFPPIVDDPFSFGRIAAANALSDVYAMGGKPLAGMNLVSYPTASYGKEVLKEILRGGLTALEEAEAILAGGHTIEGQELLYGLAVTGRIHPEAIWRNAGALPGDALVLTKPLGTGLLTTAAKAGLVEPDHLTLAIRWMSTLNRRAAEAARDIEVHACTDVTGFALAGHAAGMAEASRVAIEIDLAALPLLPGTLAAAEMGFVPAGTGKNRDSLGRMLQVADDADPLLMDVALDPQTSGGLLIACSPADAEALCRRLPEACVVGRVVEGPAGEIRLR